MLHKNSIQSLGKFLIPLVLGTILGFGLTQWSPNARRQVAEGFSLADIEPRLLHAASASGGESFALATGPIDDEAEGVFVLDFATGGLKCAVLNQRTGKFSGVFTANVTTELGAVKNPKYQMVTGLVDFKRGRTPRHPGMSVVYVLDSTSGNLVAYGVPWRRDGSSTGRAQVGTLQPIDGLQVRNLTARQN